MQISHTAFLQVGRWHSPKQGLDLWTRGLIYLLLYFTKMQKNHHRNSEYDFRINMYHAHWRSLPERKI